MICSWKHYIVVEDLGDSLKLWNLDEECNAGYWSADNTTLPKKTGRYQALNLDNITDDCIDLTFHRGHQYIPFHLSRQTNTEKPLEVINIIQMLDIDRQMEDYIQTHSENAEPNTLYVTENHIADEMAGQRPPADFRHYYQSKKLQKVTSIIKELNKK